MIRVKVTARGGAPASDLSQFVGNADNRWGDCVFSLNQADEEADVWFVIEDVEDDGATCRIARERVVFLSAETSWEPGFFAANAPRDAFLQQFAIIATCHDIYRPNVVHAPPFLPWMINSNHGSVFAPHERDLRFFEQLDTIEKTRDLSVFCSSQTLTANHRMRLRFVEELADHFGDRMDWFGNGVNPLPQKWDGIAPYRYTLVLENQASDDIFTEKIYDAFLGLSYPIYWGAPNLGRYFPDESFTAINIRDLAGSIATIERLVADDTAESSRLALLEAKRRVLHEWNLFGRMSSFAEGLMQRTPNAPPTEVALTSWSKAESKMVRTDVVARIGGKLSGLGRRLSSPH